MNDLLRQIDIYTDASRLSPGKNNPVATAGCGAVIVESGKIRTLSCQGSNGASKNSALAEQEAIMLGLRSVHEREWQENPKPKIILHTDQIFLTPDFQNYSDASALSGGDQDLLQEMKRLSAEMEVEFRYIKDPKSISRRTQRNPYFAQADRLAAMVAWQARFGQQGYVFSSTERLEGKEAQKFIENMGYLESPPAQGRSS